MARKVQNPARHHVDGTVGASEPALSGRRQRAPIARLRFPVGGYCLRMEASIEIEYRAEWPLIAKFRIQTCASTVICGVLTVAVTEFLFGGRRDHTILEHSF